MRSGQLITRSVTGLGAVSENAVKLLNHLYCKPYVRIKNVEAITGPSNPNAIALIARMSKLGIMTEITGRKRNKVFAHVPYREVFFEPLWLFGRLREI